MYFLKLVNVNIPKWMKMVCLMLMFNMVVLTPLCYFPEDMILIKSKMPWKLTKNEATANNNSNKVRGLSLKKSITINKNYCCIVVWARQITQVGIAGFYPILVSFLANVVGGKQVCRKVFHSSNYILMVWIKLSTFLHWIYSNSATNGYKLLNGAF